jgi:hypothetical protein
MMIRLKKSKNKYNAYKNSKKMFSFYHIFPEFFLKFKQFFKMPRKMTSDETDMGKPVQNCDFEAVSP